jgi:DNA-binding NarL/FixJ family response regulator
MSDIRVLIADDQALIRTGLAMILGAAEGINVVGEAGDGLEAVALAVEVAPDVVLMDVQMPRLDGIEATRRIRQGKGTARVIILTTFDSDSYAFDGIDAGASGFLLKDSTSEHIIAAIRAVAAGDAIVTPRITGEMIRRLGSKANQPNGEPQSEERATSLALLSALTARERDVLRLLAEGLSNLEIAEQLWLSESTVKTHVGRMLGKLNLRDRLQAVVFAHKHGLL